MINPCLDTLDVRNSINYLRNSITSYLWVRILINIIVTTTLIGDRIYYKTRNLVSFTYYLFPITPSSILL
jgi:hypothetical protein